MTGKHSSFILVLDALASRAISDISGRVVGIAVKVGEKCDKNLLKSRIHENRVVKSRLTKCIRTLLTLLHKIAIASVVDGRSKNLAVITASCLYSIKQRYKRLTA